MLPAVVHLTASGFLINDHGSIHATAEEVRPSRGYCNNDLTNPTVAPDSLSPLGEGKGEGPNRSMNSQPPKHSTGPIMKPCRKSGQILQHCTRKAAPW
jgi:hypothetical protein